MEPKTSHSHPLEIARIDTPVAGVLGLTFCPGKTDPHAMTGAWARDLDADLSAIVDWGASALVTLIEDHEFELLGVSQLGSRALARWLDWYHLPITDASVPDARFETAWDEAGMRLRGHLCCGKHVVIHCRGGLGRTGLVACRLLVELGMAPEKALTLVRTARPGAVETEAQTDYVLKQLWLQPRGAD